MEDGLKSSIMDQYQELPTRTILIRLIRPSLQVCLACSMVDGPGVTVNPEDMCQVDIAWCTGHSLEEICSLDHYLTVKKTDQSYALIVSKDGTGGTKSRPLSVRDYFPDQK